MAAWIYPSTLWFLIAAMTAALAVISLVTYRGDRHPFWANLACGVMATLTAFLAYPLCQDRPSPINWSPWLLLGAYVFFYIATDRGMTELAGSLLRPFRHSRIRAGAIIVVLFMMAAFVLLAEFVHLHAPKDEDIFLLHDPKNVYLPCASLVTTDHGRQVQVSRVAFPTLSIMKEEAVRKQTAILDRLGLMGVVIPVLQGWQHSNCHGWVFTGGRFWVDTDDVYHILKDNGYSAAHPPLAGDLCIYRSSNDEVTHSGIVRIVDSGIVLVESKWGRLGRFLHPHDRHPYTEDRPTFYRSHRLGGHLLKGLPTDCTLPVPPMRFLEDAYPSNSERSTVGI